MFFSHSVCCIINYCSSQLIFNKKVKMLFKTYSSSKWCWFLQMNFFSFQSQKLIVFTHCEWWWVYQLVTCYWIVWLLFMLMWCCDVVICTAQIHPIKPEVSSCPSSSLACSTSEVCKSESLLQWSQLEKKFHNFWWIISAKEFIIALKNITSKVHNIHVSKYCIYQKNFICWCDTTICSG